MDMEDNKVNGDIGMNKYLVELRTKIHNRIYEFKSRRERLEYLDSIEKFVDKLIEISNIMSREELDKTDLRFLNESIPLFNLSYYGETITGLGTKIIELYKKIFQKYINNIDSFYNVRKGKMNRTNGKTRICFVSDRLAGMSSVIKDRGGLIMELCMNPRYTIGIMTEANCDNMGKQLQAKASLFHVLDENISKNIKTLGDNVYDIIVYCDLHMSQKVSALGLFRLAPYQFTTFGHSETSFCLDGYFTSKLFEPLDYIQNYSEENIYALDSLNMSYPQMGTEEILKRIKSKSHFGIRDNDIVYLCTSSPFKIGVEMFEIFNMILDKDKFGYIILTRLGNDIHDVPFFEALCKYVNKEHLNRIRIIDRIMPVIDIMALYKHCSVLLDSFPFGNLNSYIEALSMGTPSVSMPTKKLNGNFTRGINEMLELEELNCKTKQDYADKAVQLANNQFYKELVISKINKNKHKLFTTFEASKEWTEIFDKLT